MLCRINLADNLSLTLAEPASNAPAYPTDRLQKGWLLARNGRKLTHEGSGFGLPIVTYGHETVFPGEAKLLECTSESPARVRVSYTLNMVERSCAPALAMAGVAAGAHAMERLDSGAGWAAPRHPDAPAICSHQAAESRFESVPSLGTVNVLYQFWGDGTMGIRARLEAWSRPGLSQMVLANEQAAIYFDQYEDSAGETLEKAGIGRWHEVPAEEAILVDRAHGVQFSIARPPSRAQLFRGWEKREGWLNWAGLDFVLPGDVPEFVYEVHVGAC